MADTKYKSNLTGPEMDQALMDMNNHVSEAWAVGTRGGQAVQPTDETYHNNAKYYAESISGTLAPLYDDTQTYNVGDLVTYQGVVYECTTAITTPEAFNPSKWEVFNLEALKAEIQAQMNTKAPVITDSASGSIASFPDGMSALVKGLKAYINPLQDLHGQSNPYPNGGGKNKLAIGRSGSTTVNNVTFTVNTDNGGNVASITVSGTASATTQFYLYSATPTKLTDLDFANNQYKISGGATGVKVGIWVYNSNNTFIGGEVSEDTDVTINYPTGASYITFIEIASRTAITTPVKVYPMIRLSTEADATFAPYSNECPISGFTGMDVSVTGINVWDEEWEVGTINDKGNNVADNARIRNKNYIPCLPNTSYYLSITGSAVFVMFYDADKNFISLQGSNYAFEFTTPADCYYIRFTPTAAYGGTYNNDISINYPSTDTSYHAYNGQVYPISWQTEAGTVYYGTLEYLGNGEWKLTATYAGTTIANLTLRGSTLGSVNAAYWFDFTSTGKAHSQSDTSPCIFSSFKVGNGYQGQFPAQGKDNASWSNLGAIDPTGAFVSFYVPDLSLDTEAKFRAQFDTTQIVYELATPIEYTLTGPDPETLYGTNNWFNDTNGNIDVTYPCDTKLYIDKKIAALA